MSTLEYQPEDGSATIQAAPLRASRTEERITETSERLQALVTDFGNAQFACGAWDGDSEYDLAKRMETELRDGIHALLADVARLTDARAAATSAEPVAWAVACEGESTYLAYPSESEAQNHVRYRIAEARVLPLYASPAPQVAALSGCPCTLVEPCSEQCSCAHPSQSGGCQRCALYGSQDQRVATATRLASLSAALEAARHQSTAWEDFGEHAAHCRECGETSWSNCDEGTRLHFAAVEANDAARPCPLETRRERDPRGPRGAANVASTPRNETSTAIGGRRADAAFNISNTTNQP